jgi:hypothetical protein
MVTTLRKSKQTYPGMLPQFQAVEDLKEQTSLRVRTKRLGTAGAIRQLLCTTAGGDRTSSDVRRHYAPYGALGPKARTALGLFHRQEVRLPGLTARGFRAGGSDDPV